MDPDCDQGEDTLSHTNGLLPFLIVTDRRSLEGLYILLMQPISHLWTADLHLREAISVMKHEHWYDGLNLIFESSFFKEYFRALDLVQPTSNELHSIRDEVFASMFFPLSHAKGVDERL